jgi:hypothetical protein
LPLSLREVSSPLVLVSLILASNEFIKTGVLAQDP